MAEETLVLLPADAPEPVHSIYGPSSAVRWINCPGSVQMLRGRPRRQGNKWTAEGTAAHKLAEYCWENGLQVGALLRRKIEVGGRTYTVDFHLASAVALYLEAIEKAVEVLGLDRSAVEIEREIDGSWMHPGLHGTADALISEDFGTLWIIDYKHGAGKVVEADTPQLALYALWQSYHGDYEKIRVTVVQPRCEHPDGPVRTYEYNLDELRAWGRDVVLPAIQAAEAEAAPLRVGAWCNWCDAYTDCPEMRKVPAALIETAKRGAVDGSKVVPVDHTLDAAAAFASLPSPEDLDHERLVKCQDLGKLLSPWFKAIDARIHALLNAGEHVPGRKLVLGRKTRSWANETDAAQYLEGIVGPLAWTQPALVTVAQAEKILKEETGKKVTLPGDLVAVSQKPQVAAEDDPRPALVRGADVFDEIENPEEIEL